MSKLKITIDSLAGLVFIFNIVNPKLVTLVSPVVLSWITLVMLVVFGVATVLELVQAGQNIPIQPPVTNNTETPPTQS